MVKATTGVMRKLSTNNILDNLKVYSVIASPPVNPTHRVGYLKVYSMITCDSNSLFLCYESVDRDK